MQSAIPPDARRTDTPRAAKLSTEELAAALRLKPQTIRAALCRKSHYMGMRPVRLPNGRLLWDAADLDRLTAGEAAK